MAALDYLDFDLEVEAGATPDVYKVSVLASPRGEASGQMTFPFNSDALENVILKLGRTRSGVRAIGSPTQDLAQKFGTTLYDALFAGEVGTCFRRSLDEAGTQGKGLRIRLRLEDAPQLAEVPWEYLYPSGLRQFLVLSTRTPIVRYLELPQPVAPLRVTPPLQVLVVVSSPSNLATLNVEAEVQRIRGALASLERAGQVRVTVIPAPAADGARTHASLMDVRRALRSGGFHVLHFIGHGGFVDATGEGMLAFEDENLLAHMVSGTTLATTISGFDSLRLVLLNACEGARQSPADPLGGVAQSLVKLGNVPAVVAMQFEITDEAATVFSSEFYAAIADGYPIDAALAEARVAVFSDNNDVEWGTPCSICGPVTDASSTSRGAPSRYHRLPRRDRLRPRASRGGSSRSWCRRGRGAAVVGAAAVPEPPLLARPVEDRPEPRCPEQKHQIRSPSNRRSRAEVCVGRSWPRLQPWWPWRSCSGPGCFPVAASRWNRPPRPARSTPARRRLCPPRRARRSAGPPCLRFATWARSQRSG